MMLDIDMQKISFKRADKDDCERIYQWRNAIEVRKGCINSEEIPYAAHAAWFTKTLSREDIVLLIAQIENEPLGVLRFDIQGNIAEISIYLVPQMIGKGMGVKLLEQGEVWVKKHLPHVQTLEAKILADNEASLNAFQKTGFVEYCKIFHKSINEG